MSSYISIQETAVSWIPEEYSRDFSNYNSRRSAIKSSRPFLFFCLIKKCQCLLLYNISYRRNRLARIVKGLLTSKKISDKTLCLTYVAFKALKNASQESIATQGGGADGKSREEY